MNIEKLGSVLAGPKLINTYTFWWHLPERFLYIILYRMDNGSTIYSLKTQRRDIQKSESDTDHTITAHVLSNYDANVYFT